MNNDKAILAFLSIEPPPETLREIGKIQANLMHACPFEVRWVKPEGMHWEIMVLPGKRAPSGPI